MSDLILALKRLRVVRDSMLGDRWLVLYTEDGPIDITRDRLLEALSKSESLDNSTIRTSTNNNVNETKGGNATNFTGSTLPISQ